MTKLENRCANCGGKFGLVSHSHWGLRFCRKACKEGFLAKTAKDHVRMRKWFGRAANGSTVPGSGPHRAPLGGDWMMITEEDS